MSDSRDPYPFTADEVTEHRLRALFDVADLHGGVGETSKRPKNPAEGTIYIDTTVKKPIWYIGGQWVDASGNPV